MSKWVGLIAAFAMIVTLGACQQEETTTVGDRTPTIDLPDKITVPEEAAAPVELAPIIEEPAATEEAAPAAPDLTEPADEALAPEGASDESGAADAAKAGLVGPEWKLNEYVATFNADSTMNIKVGDMAIPGEYSLKENDVIEISAMGTTLSGTWNGETLVINGDTVEKVQ